MRRGLSRHNNRSAGGVTAAFSPLSLFADGSQGVWYDDSLTSSMFQNGSGLAAALESPVGLQLDLSKNLALGSELSNPLTSSTGWTFSGAAVTISGGALRFTSAAINTYAFESILALNTAYAVTYTIANYVSGTMSVEADGSIVGPSRTANGTYTDYIFPSTSSKLYFFITAGTATLDITSISAKQVLGNHRFQTTSANRPTLSARYNLLLATATLATQSITTVATSYTIFFTGAGTVTLSGTYIGVFTAGTNTFTATAGTLTVTVAGSVLTADIRPTNQTVTLPAYQSVTSSTVYDTVNFPQYLKYNGSTQSLSTASVDFTATAQMSVFAGVRKLSDSTLYGSICELSASYSANSGAFTLNTPWNDRNFAVGISGTTSSNNGSTAGGSQIAPSSYVATGLFAINGATTADQLNLRLNTVLQTVARGGVTTGGGNYGNYPLYFGMRAGTSLPFNGQEYQMIIVGKTLTATQITSTETFVNNRTKAY